jgi:hypothetical protein
MSAVAMRNAGKYFGAWGAIVLCVVLLSCLFNILGAITCAALVGMMLGAFKGARWFSVAVSPVFPGVVYGMVQGARVELTQQQVIVLAAVCFGIFWLTYLVSAALFFCEQKGRKAPGPPAPALPSEPPGQDGKVAAISRGTMSETLGAATLARESCLAQLQGNWVCEAAAAGEPACRRVIQISEAKLELRAIDPSGRITLLATGDVTLQGMRPS